MKEFFLAHPYWAGFILLTLVTEVFSFVNGLLDKLSDKEGGKCDRS